MILVNVERVTKIQMVSLFVHELGHVVGLDHSCNDENRSDFRGCSTLPIDHDYRKAAMFPILGSNRGDGVGFYGYPDLKETLQKNDIERTQCLFSR
jgi:hypothetical protein